VLALGLGPLSALAFVSLALGQELRLYFERLEVWRAEQVHKADLAAKRAERWERKRLEGPVSVRTVPAVSGNGRSLAGRWPDKGAFLADADRPADLRADTLAAATGQSERNARRWLEDARKQLQGVENVDVGD
jgi:hypothetical protein